MGEVNWGRKMSSAYMVNDGEGGMDGKREGVQGWEKMEE